MTDRSHPPSLLQNGLKLSAWIAFTGALFAVGISVTVFGTPLQVLSGYLIGLEVRETGREE